ncbi:MAG TPA: YdcF family protein, partial [Pedobacter sp.]
MNKVFFLAVFLLLSSHSHSFAQRSQPDPHYKLISGSNYVESKNYYLLTLFSEIPDLKQLLLHDQVLVKLADDKRTAITDAVNNCGKDPGCYIKAVKFSDEEIRQVGERLGELYKADNELGKLVQKHLVPSGGYQLCEGPDDKQLLVKAWEQDAKAVNYTISVYAEGQKPNYPQIDSIGFNIKDKGYPELVALNAGLAVSETKNDPLFYSPTLTFALQSLEINERNRAGDDEPMAETVNKAAYDYSKKVKWDQYKYTLILVPGEGPEEKDTELSAGGMLRCRLAALQYRDGLAPFIMVSGGCVHPYKTKYNEAAEMKKFLIGTLHIPESAILMEPHARHTTTNLRNCARIIFRYGFPMDKPCITSTSKSQSYYITDTMPDRCKKELGYLPYT